jgi:eukaryotic-like serine/threonine-protein kinase
MKASVDFSSPLAGRYKILRELGQGGMATVYLAEDLRFKRRVAVKVLDPEIAAFVGGERFVREIEVAATLSHPHIVPLLDSGETPATEEQTSLLYYVMAYVDGETLRDRLRREKQLGIDDAIEIARDVATALAYAHAHGVVHRDIKPENILLTAGAAVVTDFGIAKPLASAKKESGELPGSTRMALTESGIAVGTAAYMSPEQANASDEVDGRSDIYSLSCVLYEMLVGEPPFTGPTPQAIITKRFTDPVPSAMRLRDTISPALDDALKRGLARVPADRFSSADELTTTLEIVRRSPTSPYAASALGSEPGRVAPPARGALWASAGVAALAGVAIVGWLVLRPPATTGSAADPTGELRSIAVLPFEDLSAGKDQEFLSAGMTDELITALSKIEGLRVAARTSSRTAKARGDDPREIAQALDVDALLDGSVRKSGDSLRISVQLVNASDGSTRWSDSYDGSVREVFTVQETIAREVVRALRLELRGESTLVARPTADLDAYQLYLRARLALSLRTNESLHEAARYFQQVVDRDPRSARAWTGLADAYTVLALNYWGPPGDYFARGKAAALRALELDSTLAEAHASLATVSFLYDRDWAAAEQAFQRAIAIDPDYPTAYYFYSIFLSGRLRHEESVAAARRAQELDPLSPPLSQGIGMSHVLGGQPAQAIAPLRAAVSAFPGYYFPYAWLGLALARTGQHEEGIRTARRAVELAPGNVLVESFLGMALAAAGRRDEALAIARSIETHAGSDAVPFTYLARIYSGLGEKERAFAWLRRAVRAHEGQVSSMLSAGFENIQDDPRFDEIARQVGVR